MLDTSKLPHLQPQKPTSQEEAPQEPLFKQIMHAFSSKKGMLYLCCVFVLIYTSLCIQGEHLLRQGVYRVLQELGQDGFGISYHAPSSYFAFKSGVNLDDLTITAPENMGGWTLKAGRITISSTPFTPRHVTLKVNGTHSLTTKTIGDIRLIVGQGEIKFRLPYKKDPMSIDFNLKQVQTAAPKSMEGSFLADLDLKMVQAFEISEKQKKDAFHFSLRADTVHLPAFMSRHLPPMLQSLDFKGIISGTGPDGSNSFLKKWQDNSGTIEIKQGEILWPPFSASLTGTFGFTDSFELIGAGVVKTRGFFNMLDMLQNGDYLRSRRVSVAKVVLGEQLKTEKNESSPSLTSAFSFQSGKIYVGQVLLYDRHEK